MKPRLLDLFCGAGGCGMGYSRAGFEVVGVDRDPQPQYPFEFHQADALEYLAAHGHEFDFIHASPPCQRYSTMTPKHKRDSHPDLLPVVADILRKYGDGQSVEVYCTPAPARFYELVALPEPNSVGDPQEGFVVSFGSGQWDLAKQIAVAISEGMIGFAPANNRLQRILNERTR